MLERDELAAWLRLVETPSIGRVTARRLLAAFGTPQATFESSSRQAWRELLEPAQVAALAEATESLESLTELSWQWLTSGDSQARTIVVLGDPNYPRLLLETADPPLLLYAIGRADLLNAPGVAVVGSRNPTPQGEENARSFATTLSRSGLTVVSGLALGIDAAAHEGALTGPGSTVAVVGTGLDRVYPKRHLDLARRIARDGLIVSEYALGTPPLAANFPRRNRLIAGMTRGTLVVEAALQSGSLITARLAAEAGREVFAIPGSIHAPQSRGCHALIKEGARLVDAASDVLDELHLGGGLPAGQPSSATERATSNPLLDALGHDPITLDALSARLGQPPAEISGRLLELELTGDVVRLPGQLFQRVVRG